MYFFSSLIVASCLKVIPAALRTSVKCTGTTFGGDPEECTGEGHHRGVPAITRMAAKRLTAVSSEDLGRQSCECLLNDCFISLLVRRHTEYRHTMASRRATCNPIQLNAEEERTLNNWNSVSALKHRLVLRSRRPPRGLRVAWLGLRCASRQFVLGIERGYSLFEKARKKGRSARPALRPCGSSTAPRFGRRGREKRIILWPRPRIGLSSLRSGKNPHRWKSRRAGERALRYRPLAPHSPCRTAGRASPTSRDCIHPFKRRLRLCDPEVATANSPWEFTVAAIKNRSG